MPITYKDSGVDIAAGDALVDSITRLTSKKKYPEIIGGIGGFAGLFSLENSKVKNPVLVASTDGVGTKLKLAIEYGQIRGLGQDLVAMCVNDLVCCGAKPLFFLDYFATGKLDPKSAEEVIAGIVDSLNNINCALLGGETAEMPDVYQNKDFDLAGFSVGLVDRTKIIDGRLVKAGNAVIGVASSGFHSNGYSLIRKIIASNNTSLNEQPAFLSEPLGQALLKLTAIYVNPVLEIIGKVSVHGLAHITGDGLVGNLPRVLAKNTMAMIDTKSINTPELFRSIQKLGNVPENDMWHAFNMGIGLTVVVDPVDINTTIATFATHGLSASVIGSITDANPKYPDQILLQ